MVIKGKIRILKLEDKQKVSFLVSQKVRGTRRRERRREKRRERKERREKEKKIVEQGGRCDFFFSFKLSKCSTSGSKGEEPKETKNK